MLKLCRRTARSGTSVIAVLTMCMAVAVCAVGQASATQTRPHHRNAWPAARRIDLSGVHSLRRMARAAIVGGNQISNERAPWQVAVFGFLGNEELLICGGSILDATHILTAAHCLYNPNTEARLPAADVLVVAGVSDLAQEYGDQAQVRLAAGIRVHPYFSYEAGPGTPDDIAVVELPSALTLSSVPGSFVNSIGVTPAGTTPAEGSSLSLTGYGEENPGTEELNGTLNSIGMTLGFGRRCGGEADAVFLCASATTGSACSGDSGSGLTVDATSELLGVMDFGEVISGERCRADSTDGFVNLAAPEIRDFIEGDPSPPLAPRGGNGIEVSGVPKVGHALTCQPGNWSNQPTITYLFIDSSTSGAVLQSGTSSTYQLSASDVGRTIFCEVQAANTGGTGTVRTTSLRAIESAPAPPQPPAPPTPPVTPPTSGATPGGGTPPPAAGGVEAAVVHNEHVTLLGRTIAEQSSGIASAKLDCTELEGCNGVLVLTASQTVRLKGGKKKSHRMAIGTANFSLTAGETGTVKIHLNATGRALLSAAHGHLPARLAIEVIEVPTQTDPVQLVAQQTGHGSHKGKG
jgi:hypothetical protein